MPKDQILLAANVTPYQLDNLVNGLRQRINESEREEPLLEELETLLRAKLPPDSGKPSKKEGKKYPWLQTSDPEQEDGAVGTIAGRTLANIKKAAHMEVELIINELWSAYQDNQLSKDQDEPQKESITFEIVASVDPDGSSLGYYGKRGQPKLFSRT